MSETRPNQERIFEKERLVLWTTEEIATAMQEEGMDSADLAAATGLPKASVTRIMSGSLARAEPQSGENGTRIWSDPAGPGFAPQLLSTQRIVAPAA